jgi:hypothetical protein
VNDLGEAYYFKLDGNSVLVSTSSNIKDPTNVNIIAFCSRDVIVVSCNLPSKFNGETVETKKLKTTPVGLLSHFKNIAKRCNYDMDEAAYSFIGSVGRYVPNGLSILQKYDNGDHLYNAVSLINSNNIE